MQPTVSCGDGLSAQVCAAQKNQEPQMPDRREPGEKDSMFSRGSQPPSRAAPATVTATHK
ncbi:hypothetical protein [Acinetobacter baumannii]|uniref:hypothetical protein n=1 Tax=Acinetobacter baumannii TaxID=470 RepID=UPI00339B3BF3